MKLEDITKDSSHVIAAVTLSNPCDEIKVYSLGETKIIYTLHQGKCHASLSHPSRKITNKEIDYVIAKLLHTNRNNVAIGKVTGSDVVHLSIKQLN